MPEPLQEQILANVLSTLIAIDADATGSTYFYTIGANQVVRADAAVVEPGMGPFPFLVVAAEDSHPISDSVSAGESYVTERLELVVVGFITDRSNPQRDMRRLEHDIRKALWTDPYRNDLAQRTWWEGTEFLYALPAESQSEVRVHFSIDYEVRLSDLTATT